MGDVLFAAWSIINIKGSEGYEAIFRFTTGYQG